MNPLAAAKFHARMLAFTACTVVLSASTIALIAWLGPLGLVPWFFFALGAIAIAFTWDS
jgi:hypothetical protein